MALYDVIIIGSGPAGLTAAIYTTRANLKTLVLAGSPKGGDPTRIPGGQLMATTAVENYPGFPEGVQGPELMDLIRRQAERFGSDIVDTNAVAVDFRSRPFRIKGEENEYEGRSVIIATGAQAKWIGLESERRLQNKGVSACAVCDGYFFRGLDVVVVGGGDSAMEDSLFLSKLCKTVKVVHRRDSFRASKIMQDRLRKTPNVEVLWNTEVLEILGGDKVTGVRLVNHPKGSPKDIYDRNPKDPHLKVWEVPTGGVFVAIGHTPDTETFQGHVALDAKGYMAVNDHVKTNVPGVFSAGDVHDSHYRQAVTAAGFGCMAALEAERWLATQG
ncbi:MAG: thioredoxin-disulfide reductase [Methanobacteriota archaeon]|nr:MAG: thioredoxin-disulfide reductase [Euryarchaeota archaeon]